MPSGAFWSGWVLFAALMMGLMGAYNALQGIAAIGTRGYHSAEDFERVEQHLLVADLTAWGILALGWGVALLLAAVALFAGRAWARWFELAIVALNAVLQAGMVNVFPLWSVIVIAMSALVIYALTVRWDDVQADLSDG